MLAKTCALILNYNEYQLTIDCVKSISKTGDAACSIIVVDNASSNESVKILSKLDKIDKLICLNVNGGYTHGNNVGLEYCFNNGAEYVFVLNNDTIVERDCIKLLLEQLKTNKSIGIIGPKVLYMSKPDTINYAGMRGNISKAEYQRIGLDEKDNETYSKLIETLYQDGCALMITKSCYDEIGGFDSNLWTYWEECDLCMRARRNNYRVCCYQKAIIWHSVSQTLGKYQERSPVSDYYGMRNSIIIYKRYAANRKVKYSTISKVILQLPIKILFIVWHRREKCLRNIFSLLAGSFVGVFSPRYQPWSWFAPIKPYVPKKTVNWSIK